MKYNTNIIDLTNFNNDLLCFCGDIHGEFKTFLYEVKRRQITNAIIVICGDIGMGFNKPKYYENELGKISKILKKLNNIVLCIRGNHDDPAWFKYTKQYSDSLAYYYPNWVFVNDYDIIKTKFGNILCIGGARSIDKMIRIPNKTWWEDENIIPITGEMLLDINKRCNNIDIVVSHTAPDICDPQIKTNLYEWSKIDPDVIDDCDKERKQLTHVYNELIKYHNVKFWFYGHFHDSYYTFVTTSNKDTTFYGLGIMEFKELIINNENK